MQNPIIKAILLIVALIATVMPLQAANTCLMFSNNTQSVSLNSSYTFGTTFTQEMWVYPQDATVAWRCLLGNITSDPTLRPPSIYQYGLKVHCGFGDGSNWNYFTTANDVLTKDSWNHLAVTFDGTDYTLYVNGTSVFTTAALAGKVPFSTAKLTEFGYGYEANCKMEELRVWSTARTQAEVQNNMYKELLGTESGLMAYYQMNEGSGTAVTDKTVNANHGTLVGMDNSNWQSSNFYSVDLSSNPTQGGSLSGNGTYWLGSIATLTATANSDYRFVNWTKNDTIVSASATYNYTLPAKNSTLVANFEVIPFTDIYLNLPGVKSGSVAWGDYDNDGDLDILLTGIDNSSNYPISRIYRNDPSTGSGRTFTDINAGLTGVHVGSVVWGDYDNDGDLDILLTGNTGSGFISRIYRNDNGAFTDINAGLPGVYQSSVAWGDYDNDGDLDILLTGQLGYNNNISRIYRNDNGLFFDINACLPCVKSGSVAWGDYDNDGYLDILFTGVLGTFGGFDYSISKVYRNNRNGTFTEIYLNLAGVKSGSVAWGDYDNDGDLDILLTGIYYNIWDYLYHPSSYIYSNNGNGTFFSDINAGLPGVYYGSVAWGDYDNDGDLDILLTGSLESNLNQNFISKIYRNNGNSTFSDFNAGLTGVAASSVAWGDYDNDGDLDILLTGMSTSGISKIYRNNSLTANTAPAAPANLSAQNSTDGIIFSWSKATDSQTPPNGLSYNLAIGNSANQDSIKCSQADLATGYRKVVALGNTNKVNSYKLDLILPQATYHWSVQAIDQAFAGSPFTSGTPISSTRNLAIFNESELNADESIVWESIYLDNITGYQIQISEDNSFATTVIDTLLAKSSLVTKDAKGFFVFKLNRFNKISTLQNNTTYYWRIKPKYNVGLETFFSPTPNSFVFKTQSPNSPTNGLPSGTSVAVTTTTINWTAPAAGVTPTSYSVYLYSAEDCFTTPIVNGASVTTTSFSGLLLKYNTDYQVKIFANYDPTFKGTSPALEWFFRTERKPGYSITGQVAFDGGYLTNYFIAGTFNEGNTIYNVNVAHGDSVVLMPKKEGYAFTPAKTTLRNVTANQTVNFTAADTLAPVVKALAQSVTNGPNQVVKAQSNEATGFVYVVKSTENPQSVTDIDALITAKKAAKTAVAQSYTDYNIATTGLLSGNYYAYAADKWSNLSVKGTNILLIDQGSAIGEENLPTETKLYANYPNPFNPMTEIKFDLKNSGMVKLTVYSTKGEVVKTLVNGMQNAGRYSVNFDGAGFNSGVYFYKLEADEKCIVNKMLMVK